MLSECNAFITSSLIQNLLWNKDLQFYQSKKKNYTLSEIVLESENETKIERIIYLQLNTLFLYLFAFNNLVNSCSCEKNAEG